MTDWIQQWGPMFLAEVPILVPCPLECHANPLRLPNQLFRFLLPAICFQPDLLLCFLLPALCSLHNLLLFSVNCTIYHCIACALPSLPYTTYIVYPWHLWHACFRLVTPELWYRSFLKDYAMAVVAKNMFVFFFLHCVHICKLPYGRTVSGSEWSGKSRLSLLKTESYIVFCDEFATSFADKVICIWLDLGTTLSAAVSSSRAVEAPSCLVCIYQFQLLSPTNVKDVGN